MAGATSSRSQSAIISAIGQRKVAGGDSTMRCLSGNDTESSATTSLARHSPGPVIGNSALKSANRLAGVVQRDAKGFIVTGHDVELGSWPMQRKPMTFETSVAIGDVRLGSTKRVASAVGDGAGAVTDIHQYLNEADQSVADIRERFPGSIAA